MYALTGAGANVPHENMALPGAELHHRLAGHLPFAQLMATIRSEQFALRPASAADQAFLLTLFASTRAAELAMLPFDELTSTQLYLEAFSNAAREVTYRAEFTQLA